MRMDSGTKLFSIAVVCQSPVSFVSGGCRRVCLFVRSFVVHSWLPPDCFICWVGKSNSSKLFVFFVLFVRSLAKQK